MAYSKVCSELPGVFYVRANPDASPYKGPGEVVKVGDVLGLIEIMKTFYEVRAKESGTFVQYLAQNEAVVEAGDELAEIEGEGASLR
jgi:biotin carboxyl carrier protein